MPATMVFFYTSTGKDPKIIHKPNGIDLISYEDVKKRAKDIYSRLSAGDMPCDGPWSDANIQKVKQ